jgi:hypothetical protein
VRSAVAAAAAIGTVRRRARRCMSMGRCMAGRIEATLVRSWICISPSYGLRLTAAVTVAIAVPPATVDHVACLAMVDLTAATAEVVVM